MALVRGICCISLILKSITDLARCIFGGGGMPLIAQHIVHFILMPLLHNITISKTL
jgi:hypothetical protein